MLRFCSIQQTLMLSGCRCCSYSVVNLGDTAVREDVRAMSVELEPSLLRWRRDFHKYAEVGWTEFRTSAIIATHLKDLGYEVKIGEQVITRADMLGVPSPEELDLHMERAIRQGADQAFVKQMAGGMTGVIADLKVGEGPTVALRFDIDANDVSESSDPNHRPSREGFSSINLGVMHACGHDGHTSIGMGVAQTLAGLKDRLRCNIRLIFELGEEGSRGARAMNSAGAVKGIDYILGFHIGMQAKKNGQLICGTGRFLAATKYDIIYNGVPAHAGAAPEEGRNALLAASCASLNLHAITRHSKGASRINVGTLVAGQGRNVIPSHAVFKIETRGETTEIDEFMAAEAKLIVTATAQMYGVGCEIQHLGSIKSGESSLELRDRLKQTAQTMDWFSEIIDYANFGATEDFSLFMTTVQNRGGQGNYFMLGADLRSGHHTDFFDFDESIMVKGVELIVSSVLDLTGTRQNKSAE